MKKLHIFTQQTQDFPEQSASNNIISLFHTMRLMDCQIDNIIASEQPIGAYLRSIFVSYDTIPAFDHAKKLMDFIREAEKRNLTIQIDVLTVDVKGTPKNE
jgi:hypothetical protein